MSTNVEKFFSELDGGVFVEQLGAILSASAAGVVDHDRTGEVTIKLGLRKIGNGHQVAVNHTLKYSHPTKRGKIGEEQTTSTPMHVGKNGALSFFPENQGTMFDKRGQLADGEQRYPNTTQD